MNESERGDIPAGTSKRQSMHRRITKPGNINSQQLSSISDSQNSWSMSAWSNPIQSTPIEGPASTTMDQGTGFDISKSGAPDSLAAKLSLMSSPVRIRGLEEFHLFTKMPIELQERVWFFAAREPRFVEIFTRTGKVTAAGTPCSFSSYSLAPAMLQTSANARKAGLKIYSKLKLPGKPARTYINWDHDYVVLPHRLFLDPSSPNYLSYGLGKLLSVEQKIEGGAEKSDLGEKSQHIAVSFYARSSLTSQVLNMLPNLADITFIDGPDINQPTASSGDFQFQRKNIQLYSGVEPIDAHSVDKHYADKGLPAPELYHARNVRRGGAKLKNRVQKKATQAGLLPLVKSKRPTKKKTFSGLNLDKLRKEAGARGLDTSGGKAELLGRLQADEEIVFKNAMEEHEKADNTARHAYYLAKNPGAC